MTPFAAPPTRTAVLPFFSGAAKLCIQSLRIQNGTKSTSAGSSCFADTAATAASHSSSVWPTQIVSAGSTAAS